MSSLISANEWPVFDRYGLTRNHDGQLCVGPEEGATIREWVNLLDPSPRHEALLEAMKLMKRSRRCGDERNPDERFHIGVGLAPGRIREDAVLEYAARFGLFGLGPSRLVRVAQQTEERPDWEIVVRRQAGELRWTGKHTVAGSAPTRRAPAVILEDRASDPEPSWHPYCPLNCTEAQAFSHEVGTEPWWETYVEPLSEMAFALYELELPSGLERRLADTFVDLSAVKGSLVIERQRIGWRSISAMGALALDVLEGGLNDWSVCAYELCRAPFKPKRKGQRFCRESHRTGQWDLEHPKAKRS